MEGTYIEFYAVAGDLWSNVEIVKAFVDQQNSEEFRIPPLPPGFPDAMRDNEDLGLFATK